MPRSPVQSKRLRLQHLRCRLKFPVKVLDRLSDIQPGSSAVNLSTARAFLRRLSQHGAVSVKMPISAGRKCPITDRSRAGPSADQALLLPVCCRTIHRQSTVLTIHIFKSYLDLSGMLVTMADVFWDAARKLRSVMGTACSRTWASFRCATHWHGCHAV